MTYQILKLLYYRQYTRNYLIQTGFQFHESLAFLAVSVLEQAILAQALRFQLQFVPISNKLIDYKWEISEFNFQNKKQVAIAMWCFWMIKHM